MGWSAGTFSRARDWTADEAGAINMEAVNFDQEDDNFATGINTCITKDGQNTPTGNLPMGTNKHTGVGNATAKTDYASAADVIDQHLTYYVDTGAADAYVVTPSPSIAGYSEGQKLVFRSTNVNTGASTLNVNALGVKAIETADGNALTAGMIAVGEYYEVTYDAQATTRFVLTSPHSFQPVITAGAGMTGGGTLPASVTVNCIGGTGITVNADDIALSASVAGTGMTHTAGVLNVIGGDGITANADDIAISATVAGTGMTHTTGVLNVIGGDGITANADDIAISATVAGAGMTHTTGVLNVIGGDGITATADAIALSATVGGDGLTYATGVLHLTNAAASTTNPVDIAEGTVSLDVEALTTIEGSTLAATDTLYVEKGGVSNGVEVQALGLRVQTAQTTQTLAAADMNSIMEFTATATLTLPINSGVDLPVGVPIVLNMKHATQVLTVTAAASVTLVTPNHPAGGVAASDTLSAGGSAILYKTAADVWALSGDIVD